jgi:hypothetical protein
VACLERLSKKNEPIRIASFWVDIGRWDSQKTKECNPLNCMACFFISSFLVHGTSDVCKVNVQAEL